MLTTKERPPLARAALPAVPVGKRERPENKLTARQRQTLIEQIDRLDRARLDCLISDDYGRALGIEPLDDVPAILSARIQALRLLLLGRADLADLPREWPKHASRAAVSYRAERARRARR